MPTIDTRTDIDKLLEIDNVLAQGMASGPLGITAAGSAALILINKMILEQQARSIKKKLAEKQAEEQLKLIANIR